MIEYTSYKLKNGLEVVLHQDLFTPLAAVNVLYKAGSKYESPGKTGFAHLFEHLMFSGSAQVPDYDQVLQDAGGENNAYTNSDITNYYSILPVVNLDVSLWAESDRMCHLKLTEEKLNIQKNVVIEEFHETVDNEPFGEVYHHIYDMAYKDHPYKWPVIGKDPSHISSASLPEIEKFYQKHYHPGNAVLVVCSPLPVEVMTEKVEFYFGGLTSGSPVNYKGFQKNSGIHRNILELESETSTEALYLVWKMPHRRHHDYYALDLLTDILSNGKTSILYKELVRQREILTSIDMYPTGSEEPGLIILEAKVHQNSSPNEAEEWILKILQRLQQKSFPDKLINKARNKLESSLVFSETSVLGKAINLAYYASIGDLDLINNELAAYEKVDSNLLKKVAEKYLRPEDRQKVQYVRPL